jgi:hypothetical protein
MLILLPLASGIILVPPLLFWLACHTTCDWWSGKPLSRTARVIGVIALMICAAVDALYFSGYISPAYHPPPPSLRAAVVTTLQYLSLAIAPCAPQLWRPAGICAAVLTAATIVQLVVAAVQSRDERVRASGLIAVIAAMCLTACAVGYFRSGIGYGMGLASRYVTLTAPLLAVLYVAWIPYGHKWARYAVQFTLFILVCLAFRDATNAGLQQGRRVKQEERIVERKLLARAPISEVVRKTSLYFEPNSPAVRHSYNVLKQANFGAFKFLSDDRVASSSNEPLGAIRR